MCSMARRDYESATRLAHGEDDSPSESLQRTAFQDSLHPMSSILGAHPPRLLVGTSAHPPRPLVVDACCPQERWQVWWGALQSIVPAEPTPFRRAGFGEPNAGQARRVSCRRFTYWGLEKS